MVPGAFPAPLLASLGVPCFLPARPEFRWRSDRSRFAGEPGFVRERTDRGVDRAYPDPSRKTPRGSVIMAESSVDAVKSVVADSLCHRAPTVAACTQGVSNGREGIKMTINKDQVKGELKDLGGKIQEEAGKLIGSKEQQAKGLKHQAEGKLQKSVGDLKEAVTDAITKA